MTVAITGIAGPGRQQEKAGRARDFAAGAATAAASRTAGAMAGSGAARYGCAPSRKRCGFWSSWRRRRRGQDDRPERPDLPAAVLLARGIRRGRAPGFDQAFNRFYHATVSPQDGARKLGVVIRSGVHVGTPYRLPGRARRRFFGRGRRVGDRCKRFAVHS